MSVETTQKKEFTLGVHGDVAFMAPENDVREKSDSLVFDPLLNVSIRMGGTVFLPEDAVRLRFEGITRVGQISGAYLRGRDEKENAASLNGRYFQSAPIGFRVGADKWMGKILNGDGPEDDIWVGVYSEISLNNYYNYDYYQAPRMLPNGDMVQNNSRSLPGVTLMTGLALNADGIRVEAGPVAMINAGFKDFSPSPTKLGWQLSVGVDVQKFSQFIKHQKNSRDEAPVAQPFVGPMR